MIELLRSFDAWFLIALLLAILWAVEIVYGRRESFMQGVTKGYSMAARHVRQAREGLEEIDL